MRRTTMTLSAVTLTAAVLSACGSPAGDSSSGDGGQNSSGGAFDSVTSLVDASTQSMNGKDTARMAIDIAGGPQGGQHLDCQVDLGKQDVACGGDQELVSTGDAVYVKVPQMAELGGESGKPWMKTDISGMPQQQGADVSKFQDLQSMLPPGTEIANTSEEQVDGQQATKYETVTDVRKAVQEAPEQQKKILQPVADAGVDQLRQTVWVGEDDLPIRVKSVVPPMEIMGQQVPETTTTVNYSEWGEPVDITVPPADQVQEMPGMGGNTPQMPN
ncbi:hypothetical protein [Salinifilum ghardaiensis]